VVADVKCATESYISLACPDMPSLFFFTGPNATVGHGSLIYSLDWSAEWMLQWIRKMAYEDIASIAPKQEVVDVSSSPTKILP
jgi:hypothetical protein